MTFIDLRPAHGRPLSLAELGSALGLSHETIRREIKAGEIRAVRVGPSRLHYRIPWDECRRYAIQLGILRPVSTCQTTLSPKHAQTRTLG